MVSGSRDRHRSRRQQGRGTVWLHPLVVDGIRYTAVGLCDRVLEVRVVSINDDLGSTQDTRGDHCPETVLAVPIGATPRVVPRCARNRTASPHAYRIRRVLRDGLIEVDYPGRKGHLHCERQAVDRAAIGVVEVVVGPNADREVVRRPDRGRADDLVVIVDRRACNRAESVGQGSIRILVHSDLRRRLTGRHRDDEVDPVLAVVVVLMRVPTQHLDQPGHRTGRRGRCRSYRHRHGHE